MLKCPHCARLGLWIGQLFCQSQQLLTDKKRQDCLRLVLRQQGRCQHRRQISFGNSVAQRAWGWAGQVQPDQKSREITRQWQPSLSLHIDSDDLAIAPHGIHRHEIAMGGGTGKAGPLQGAGPV